MQETNRYLLRRLEESARYYASSFSNRYMNWKRRYSIIKFLFKELRRLKEEGKSVIKILEVACNDGWFIYRLKSEFSPKYNLEFTGIDISGFDINFANERKRYFNHHNCQFIIMDANNLILPEENFDIVIASEIIEHMQNPQIIVKEIFRVLKSGGTAIITTPNKGDNIFAKFLSAIISLLGLKPKEFEEDIILMSIPQEEKQSARLISSDGKTGSGYDHISVKKINEWKGIFRKNNFKIKSTSGTGGILLGTPYLDKHRVLFGLLVILDTILEQFPLSYLWSEVALFELKKGCGWKK